MWTGLVMITDEMEYDGLTFVIHREILEIDPTALCLIILDAGRMAKIGQRRGDLMTGDVVQAFAQISGFEIIRDWCEDPRFVCRARHVAGVLCPCGDRTHRSWPVDGAILPRVYLHKQKRCDSPPWHGWPVGNAWRCRCPALTNTWNHGRSAGPDRTRCHGSRGCFFQTRNRLPAEPRDSARQQVGLNTRGERSWSAFRRTSYVCRTL